MDRKSPDPEVTENHVDQKSHGPEPEVTEITWTGSDRDGKSRGPEMT